MVGRTRVSACDAELGLASNFEIGDRPSLRVNSAASGATVSPLAA